MGKKFARRVCWGNGLHSPRGNLGDVLRAAGRGDVVEFRSFSMNKLPPRRLASALRMYGTKRQEFTKMVLSLLSIVYCHVDLVLH